MSSIRACPLCGVLGHTGTVLQPVLSYHGWPHQGAAPTSGHPVPNSPPNKMKLQIWLTI